MLFTYRRCNILADSVSTLLVCLAHFIDSTHFINPKNYNSMIYHD